MIINYGSPAYCLYLFVAAAIVLFFYVFFRNKTDKAKNAALLTLAGVNLFQHLFKFIVWPHLYGTGFNLINTAYNVCAFMIMITPFVIVSKNMLMRQFVAYVGTAGGALALLVPQWFTGQTMFQWEFFRGWTCHALLLATSLLPPLWGKTRFYARDGWKIGLIFFAMLALILLDNVICICAGMYAGGGKDNLFECLLALNPLWMMHPPALFPWLKSLLEFFTFDFFLGNETRPYTPVMWYFLPMFLAITAAATAFGAAAQRLDGGRKKRKNLLIPPQKGIIRPDL